MQRFIVPKLALRTLHRTPLRSGLTMLGIIIGVAAVITMVSLGNGARAQVEANLAGFDANQITITAFMPRRLWLSGRPIRTPPNDGLQLTDYELLRSQVHGITAISLQIVSRNIAAVSANGRNSDAQVSGVDVDGLKVFSRELVHGNNFSLTHVREASPVCLISEFVADNLFPNEYPLDRWIRIQDTPLLVIGVLKDGQPRDPTRPEVGDTTIYTPYTSLRRRLDRESSMRITLRPETPDHIETITQQISELLERNRGGRQAEFNVGGDEAYVRRYRAGSEAMQILLGSIGSISLLVGGIGIMNIMLVSVTERKREIGIRLALGTRNRDVLRQFLIEAMMLTGLGGMIGVVLGLASTILLTALDEWPVKITLSSVLLAFLCSTLVGVLFGYIPARRAVQLDPIEALRTE